MRGTERTTKPRQNYRDDLVRGEMAAQKLTVEQVAEASQLSSFTVSAIRNGTANVTVASLRKVADALQIEWSRLFEEKPKTVKTPGEEMSASTVSP